MIQISPANREELLKRLRKMFVDLIANPGKIQCTSINWCSKVFSYNDRTFTMQRVGKIFKVILHDAENGEDLYIEVNFTTPLFEPFWELLCEKSVSMELQQANAAELDRIKQIFGE